ncbi:VanZ family protein [Alteromonas sp. 14N.309.X.WAT.G.H12]|uniref:VanZ family protein n=1 Tax=Alteromonas sp. 14N.309.X.WAT.G.H12 TaxID=3120824 RepID=UPI002FD79722
MIRSPLLFKCLLMVLMVSFALLFLPTTLWPFDLSTAFNKYSWLDDVAHATLFSVLCLGVQSSLFLSRRKTVFGLLFFAIVTEVVQGTISSGRTASVSDVIADFSGIVIGLALFKLARPVLSGLFRTTFAR